MIKDILKIGVGRVVQLVGVLFLVFSLNLALLILNLWGMSSEGLHAGEWLRFLLALGLALGTGGFTLWRIYAVASLEVFKLFYDKYTPQIADFSKKVVVAVKKNMKSDQVEKGRVIDQQLKNLPWVLRLPMKLLMKFIPIFKLIEAAKKALLEHNEDYAAKQFHKDLDEVIQEVYFDATSLKWLAWLLPLITVGHGALIWFVF